MEKNPNDKKVFDQELSTDDLSAVSGGENGPEDSHCVKQHYRNIHKDGCAATVGDGSWCGTNDACYHDAVVYTGMKDCNKAWK